MSRSIWLAAGAKISDCAQLFDPIIMTKAEHIVIEGYARIDSFVKLEGGRGLRIGRYVHIASFSHIGVGGGETIIGDYAAVASGGKIISGMNSPDFPSLSPCASDVLQQARTFRTVLEPYACVFTNAVVLPGVTLHEGAVLGAGSVALRSIPEWEVWFGNPARFASKRDKARTIAEVVLV